MMSLYFGAWEHSIVNALTSKGDVNVVGDPFMLPLITSSYSVQAWTLKVHHFLQLIRCFVSKTSFLKVTTVVTIGFS